MPPKARKYAGPRRPGERSAKVTAGKALKMAKSNKRLLTSDPKWSVRNRSAVVVPINTVGFDLDATALTQIKSSNPDAPNEHRNSDTIYIKAIRVNYIIGQNALSTLPDYVRLLLFWDNRNDAEVTQLGEVIADAGTAYTGMISQRNRLYIRKFSVMFDRLHKVDPYKPSLKGSFTKYYKRGLRVKYVSTTGTIAALDNKCLYLAWAGTAAANRPTLDFTLELLYVD